MVAPKFELPVNGKVSASFQAHKDRKPPSVNPGTDYAVAEGTPVKAAAAGKVIAIKTSNSNATGRFVVVDHGEGWVTEYLHLSRVLVRAGEPVKKGDRLGLSGGSGFGRENGYAPHLHLSLRHGGVILSGSGNRDFEAVLDRQKPKQQEN